MLGAEFPQGVDKSTCDMILGRVSDYIFMLPLAHPVTCERTRQDGELVYFTLKWPQDLVKGFDVDYTGRSSILNILKSTEFKLKEEELINLIPKRLELLVTQKVFYLQIYDYNNMVVETKELHQNIKTVHGLVLMHVDDFKKLAKTFKRTKEVVSVCAQGFKELGAVIPKYLKRIIGNNYNKFIEDTYVSVTKYLTDAYHKEMVSEGSVPTSEEYIDKFVWVHNKERSHDINFVEKQDTVNKLPGGKLQCIVQNNHLVDESLLDCFKREVVEEWGLDEAPIVKHRWLHERFHNELVGVYHITL